MGIYDYIPRDRYITREELVNITGWSDRRIRDEINKLRKNPETIVISSSNGKGYKLPDSVREIEGYLKESLSRTRDEQEKQAAALKAIRKWKPNVEKSGQILFDFG